MGQYFQPEIETASREEILKIQNEKIVKQVRHVYENVPYYRNLMDEKGVKPEDIKGVDDIKKLPFLSKADLREAYPYGLLATDLKNCVRIQSTSGTTGKRVVAFYTQNDVDLWEECTARAIVAAGGDENDVCQVCYGYGLFTGGPGLHGGSHKVGCLTLPMSSGNTERQIQFMMDLGATILCCTPSYAAYIGETLAEMGYKPGDNKLKAGIFGAEPWTEEMRRNIEQSLGIKAYDIYGLTEISGPGDRALRLSARARRACTSTRTTSTPRSSIPTQARRFPTAQRESWYSPLSTRRRSRFSATERAISAC